MAPGKNLTPQSKATTLGATTRVVATEWGFFSEFAGKIGSIPSGGIENLAWANRLAVMMTLGYHNKNPALHLFGATKKR